MHSLKPLSDDKAAKKIKRFLKANAAEAESGAKLNDGALKIFTSSPERFGATLCSRNAANSLCRVRCIRPSCACFRRQTLRTSSS